MSAPGTPSGTPAGSVPRPGPSAGPAAPARAWSPGARLRGSTRLTGVDAARAVALLGMVATHVLPLVAADGTPSAAAQVAAGRASALFAVLAGVSLALAHGGVRRPTGRDLSRARAGVAARAGVVGLVGLLLGSSGLFLGSSGPPVAVILVNYALLFVVALPVLGWGARPLLLLAAAWLVLVPVASFPLRRLATGGAEEDGLLSLFPGSSPSLLSLADPVTLLGQLLLTGYYPVLTWTGLLLLGLGLGRLDLRRVPVVVLVTVAGAATAVLARVVAAVLAAAAAPHLDVPPSFPLSAEPLSLALQTGLYGTTPTTSWWWLAVVAPHSGTPLDLLHVAGSALAVLGLALLLARASRALVWPLAATGSMTLTLYSAHVVSLVALSGWIDGDPFAGTAPADPLVVYLAQVLALVAVAVAWQLTGRRGPLEALTASASAAARSAVR